MNVFSALLNVLNSDIFLFITMTSSFFIKLYFIFILMKKGIKTKNKIKIPWLLLIGILLGSAIGDLTWVVKYVKIFLIPTVPYCIRLFISRAAFALLIMQYQSLNLLIEHIINKSNNFSILRKFILFIGFLMELYLLYLAFFDSAGHVESDRILLRTLPITLDSPLEKQIVRWYMPLYILSITVITLIPLFYSKKKINKLPKIIQKQIMILLQFFLIPFLVLEFLIASKSVSGTNAIMTLSTIFITAAIFYCIKKILPLRFLNLTDHVDTQRPFNFIENFNDSVRQLTQAATSQELICITEHFFTKALNINPDAISIYIHPSEQTLFAIDDNPSTNLTNNNLTSLITDKNSIIHTELQQKNILIYDEIEFNYHCTKDQTCQQLLTMLNTIDADILLPIYQNNKIVASVVIKKNALPNSLYEKTQQDEMLVFSYYLGNMMHKIKTEHLRLLAKEYKVLENELYDKHQEIQQYKESISTFLTNENNSIGILFYKNRKFTYANQKIMEIISTNINTHKGHPLTKHIESVAESVEKYKTPKTIFTHNEIGKEIIITGIPCIEKNNVVITINYPTISDIIKRKIAQLKDPSRWDLLLYLDTTTSGKMINELFPGTSNTLLNFKVALLKVALSKKATLLEIPDEDMLPTVELIHRIGLGTSLHTISLQGPCVDDTLASQLFGVHDIFALSEKKVPLLQQLTHHGTLFIHNIEYADLKTQKRLLEYIKEGYFTPLNSHERIKSTARLLFSSSHNLQHYIHENKFSKELYYELQKMSLTMPALHELPQEELHNITDELIKNTLQKNSLHGFVEFTDKEKNKIMQDKTKSIALLKKKIEHVANNKIKTKQISHEMVLHTSDATHDQTIQAICKHGKNALKDKDMMTTLWNIVKNQNTMAILLGVNRSSISRRCKEYDLC